ncbi:MAG: hypothetical protein R6W97_12285 [Thiobacillus sp.]
MKSVPILFALIFSASAFATGPIPPGHPPVAKAMNKPALTQTGKVLSTLSVPSYTYIEVSQGKKTLWLATTTRGVKKGDMVRFDEGMVMTDFYSKSLKRSFPSLLFVNSLVVDNVRK